MPRRITIKPLGWTGAEHTQHLILTFSTPDLPQTVKMAYIRCPSSTVHPKSAALLSVPTIRLPNIVCRGQPIFGPRCGESGHDSADLNPLSACCRLSTRLRLTIISRSQYSRYSAIYTDGSKRADYVGCGVVIEDIMHGFRLDTSCSIFTAEEAVAIYRALQPLIDSTMPLDSYSKGFDIVFCWLPSHVGIIGNESGQRGKVGDDPSAARSSAIGYEARHLASYFSDLAGIMESAVG
ncbi:pggt1b [Trichonephila clavipes]|nr:pggt1b [Trichonephila clavipes]